MNVAEAHWLPGSQRSVVGISSRLAEQLALICSIYHRFELQHDVTEHVGSTIQVYTFYSISIIWI